MEALQTESEKEMRSKVGDTFSALAVSVLSLNDKGWPELFPFLLELSEHENQELRYSGMKVFRFELSSFLPLEFMFQVELNCSFPLLTPFTQ